MSFNTRPRAFACGFIAAIFGVAVFGVGGNKQNAAAITGMRVCRTRGGGAPHAREAARRRVAFLLDPALRRLEAILKDPAH
jgi:hypothetical protein